ncbi:protein I'm not dead yet-like isoform X2 [Musca domestica]|uniref:Protein I'm not dead yet-like isoform X2 n=1 Tax=Musca domestica TaxID=7370 RepID=A0A9J7DG53_MUSDO|nr:protein I'm not dead yet-like isoform X2 [Musca domestica]
MSDFELPSKAALATRFCRYHWKGVLTICIPLAFSPLIFCFPGRAEFRCMYLILICCFYWITECIPLYVTSLMPIFALPAMQILSSERTCQNYFKDTLAMFLGSLIVASAIEYCNLHKRLALKTILLVGCSPRRLHIGLICVTSFISMWISNSATTAMMCPIVKAVLQELETNHVLEIWMPEDEEPASEGKRHSSRVALAFYFGIAYASTIGGCGTLIGTGTNLTFKGLFEGRFPEATDKIDFPRFMGWSMPMVIGDTVLLFLSLQISHMGLGRRSSQVAKELSSGAQAADTVSSIKTSAAVMLTVLALFLFPMTCYYCHHLRSKGPHPSQRERSLLTWDFVHNHVPWGLVFLLGGGFALADASQESGMAKLLGETMSALQSWPDFAIQFSAISAGIFLTNFSANVPICNILIPILQELAVAIKMNPIMLVFPAGIATSMAFHLPVGTPPNAIVAGYAGIKSKYMVEAGILPTIFTLLMLLVNVQIMHYLIYPSREFPIWAQTPRNNEF